jgi:hypothetical protein
LHPTTQVPGPAHESIPIRLSTEYQTKYPDLQGLIDDAQKPEVLHDKKQFNLAVEGIYNRLVPKLTTPKPVDVQLFGHIREKLLVLRGSALLEGKVAQIAARRQ